MKYKNKHTLSKKQRLMTKKQFSLTVLLIAGIVITAGTMALTVFFKLSMPIKITVSALLIIDSIVSIIFTISTSIKERNSTDDFYFGNRLEIFAFCLVMVIWAIVIFII